MEKQKEFNSKAQKIRRIKSDLAKAGLSNVNIISRESSIKAGRMAIKNPTQDINIHKTINNPSLSLEDRMRNVYANKVNHNLKRLSSVTPANNKVKSIPRIRIKSR